ncbi:hypothetical protein R1flu_026584 [Riccia fluitans]|uniref:Uncharacterized protein n=1 Tax=Riccia fluitans TaxID=41844 RepID=A0ABD1XJA5_9MARC
MGVWRSFKGWVKRTVMRMVMRVVRTRIYKFARKIARATAIPLSITVGASAAGACVASAAAFPVVQGALIGAGVGVIMVVSARLWWRYRDAQRTRRRSFTTFSISGRKVSTNVICVCDVQAHVHPASNVICMNCF